MSFDMQDIEHAQVSTASPVLVVDLDGTLIKTDLLVETTVAFLTKSPLSFPWLAVWLAHGKANLKERIAERADIDPESLPYNEEFLDFIRAEHAAGRKIWLATASHHKVAAQVAAHLGVFERILATENGHNLSGEAKLDALVSELGPYGFDYAGNALVDLRIWPQARRALLVHPERGVERAAAQQFTVDRVFRRARKRWPALLRALRLHQWVKNALIFVPLLLAHRAHEWPLMVATVIAFLAFSLTASSAYVLNDLLDLAADRHHPRKRHRPFASGDLPLSVGFWLVPVLLVAAGALATMLPPAFVMVVAIYLAGTLAYSFTLKHHPMLDVMTLAGLYTLRIIAGVVAIALAPTFWLLAFSVMIFLSLALIKRYSELRVMEREGKHEARGRGYQVGDLTILSAAGIASGYLAALVLALYVNSPEVLRLYRTPEAIWLLCGLVLYWVSRMWMITHRGDMHDDPIVFALTDGPSVVIGALAVAIVIGATV
jgi:4-hydroxybenzoate polyprenyltransferase/phosphoserine phosphatase